MGYLDRLLVIITDLIRARFSRPLLTGLYRKTPATDSARHRRYADQSRQLLGAKCQIIQRLHVLLKFSARLAPINTDVTRSSFSNQLTPFAPLIVHAAVPFHSISAAVEVGFGEHFRRQTTNFIPLRCIRESCGIPLRYFPVSNP